MTYALYDYSKTSAIRKRKKLIAFGWYGGKYSHLNWLLPLLPKTKHYCEPFGGSAAVLLNREPAEVETYNDIDGEVANFFKILRNKKEELICQIGLTPFSREEFRLAIETNGQNETISDLERARRFFVRARQVRTGLAQTALFKNLQGRNGWSGFKVARKRRRPGIYCNTIVKSPN
jgi:site-specific DNA-adenine methylase